MEFIHRKIFEEFSRKVRANKVLILLGARRVGKTALIKKYLATQNKDDYILLNGEDLSTHDILAERTVKNYTRLIGKQTLLVIDEAQKIPDIGLKLKLMIDSIEGLRIIATGSSIFDLTNKLGEPLLGRSNTLQLFPLGQIELNKIERYKETQEKLEERLIFGGYPELEHFDEWEEKINYLDNLVGSNLIRDILEFEGIKKADKIMDLLKLLAFQIGQEVNIDELAKNLKGISRNTVERYLDLLEKVFIIYKVTGFSRNLRKEITKSSRWYFYDNGVRNAVIRNFGRIDLRMDVGMLWENYVMSERIKYNYYTRRLVNNYFWRTYDQQEIDLIEEENGNLAAIEFKWNTTKKVKVPGGWKNAYPDASFEVITPANYLDFIS